jgi:ABC-type Fe3+ transport system substrate-binding protein
MEPRRALWAFALVAANMAGGAARAADADLIAAARKEGEVVWYTTQIVNPLVVNLAEDFKKRYGVTLNYVRANSTEIALRVSNEARANNLQADVYDGTTSAEVFKEAKLALKWLPDSAKAFPPDYVDPDGYWIATNYYIITAAFNTDLVKPGTEPTTWDALLDPAYKGGIVWGDTPSISAAPGFVGIVLKQLGDEKGMDYLRKLAAQKPAGVGAAARVVIDQVISGEYKIALQIFPEHADQDGGKGAPVKWIPMRPAMSAIVSTTGVLANSPHPNAGKLLLDYLVSEEGQRFYRDAFYSPANPKVEPINPAFKPGRYPTLFLSPPEAMRTLPKWTQIFKRLF